MVFWRSGVPVFAFLRVPVFRRCSVPRRGPKKSESKKNARFPSLFGWAAGFFAFPLTEKNRAQLLQPLVLRLVMSLVALPSGHHGAFLLNLQWHLLPVL